MDTLEKEAEPTWTNELAFNPQPWCARIVILVEFARPCHQGVMHTHGSILWKSEKTWATVWGWAGFRPRVAAQAQTPSVPIRASVQASIVQLAVPAHYGPLLTKLRRKGVDLTSDESWVLLNTLLEVVGQPAGHGIRFLDGSSKKNWKTAANTKPLKNVHHMKRAGPKGGGQGGLWHCRLGFLKYIYCKYCARL